MASTLSDDCSHPISSNNVCSRVWQFTGANRRAILKPWGLTWRDVGMAKGEMYASCRRVSDRLSRSSPRRAAIDRARAREASVFEHTMRSYALPCKSSVVALDEHHME